MRGARSTIQTKFGPRKGSSETFVIFATSCANPLLSRGERSNGSRDRSKGHKGAWLSTVGAVNWSTSDGPLDTRKGNSETFVIFAAFCANSAAPGRSIFRIRRFGWEFFVLDGELAFSLVHGQR
jgi:hypothetical protein